MLPLGSETLLFLPSHALSYTLRCCESVTCRYIAVVDGPAGPTRCCTIRMSVPPSRRCVAKV